jgi:hypothetical protein
VGFVLLGLVRLVFLRRWAAVLARFLLLRVVEVSDSEAEELQRPAVELVVLGSALLLEGLVLLESLLRE